MKKQQVKRKATKKQSEVKVPVGIVLKELTLWDFSEQEEVIRHNAEQLAKAILMSYYLDNFGPQHFGFEDNEE